MMLRGRLAAGLLAAMMLGTGLLGGGMPAAARGEGAVADVTQVEAVDLGQYRWQNRIVLIFGAPAGDPAYGAQADTFANREAAIADRDLLLGYFPDGVAGHFAGHDVSLAGAAALRAEYGVPAGAFRVLLIGKDGGVKLTGDKPVSADRIFALIDSMPMRQQETR